MYKFYNPNPKKNRISDCAIRAVCKATGEQWEDVFTELTVLAFAASDMPHANHVWGQYLKKRGFKKKLIDEDIFTVEDFANTHLYGRYVLATPGHAVAVVNGNYYDTWDSGEEKPEYYWEAPNEQTSNMDRHDS